MSIFDRLKDGFDLGDIPGILSDLQGGKMDLGALFNSDFLKQFTDFSNIGELLNKVGLSDPSQLLGAFQDDAKKAQLDQVVNEHSQFGNIEEMVKKAIKVQK